MARAPVEWQSRGEHTEPAKPYAAALEKRQQTQERTDARVRLSDDFVKKPSLGDAGEFTGHAWTQNRE